jgi:5-hydroxyisourate hydrolase
MPGKLTTHVLDVASGTPAAGMKISLFRDNQLLRSTITNATGRTDTPLLENDRVLSGTYRLEFSVGDYFAARQHPDAKKFLDIVPIVFIIHQPQSDYHVPLLVSPWSYSTYRGS